MRSAEVSVPVDAALQQHDDLCHLHFSGIVQCSIFRSLSLLELIWRAHVTNENRQLGEIALADINRYLRENLKAVSKDITVAPDIPEKKLNNAISSFGFNGSPHSVIALYDNTVFGTGKDGLLFSGEQMIYRAKFSDPLKFPFSSITSVGYEQKLTGSKNDKLEVSLSITCIDGTQASISDLTLCDYLKLAEILQFAISNFKEFKEERQFIPIEEMSEELKIAYVKTIINMAYYNDDVVDEKEFAEILLLMTRLSLSAESRFNLRSYIASNDTLSSVEQLIGELDSHCPEGQQRSVHVSLTKDLLNTFLATGGSSVENFAFFKRYRSLLNVSDDEVALAMAAIQNDHNMLKEDLTDDQIVSALKELSAKAAAIGTPLAAIYLSGSVIGMSAAGLTSGLAALGMGGLLGLSGMATGIGVAVLIGVGVYKGVLKLTGVDQLKSSKRRELMLNEIIKQTQGTISLLMGDINYVSLKLNECMNSLGEHSGKIQHLMKLMTQMTAAGKVLTGKADSAQSSANKLKCAAFLDEGKLKSLTREPTKQELYEFIRHFYEERTFVEGEEGEKREVTKLAIKQGQQPKDLENLANAFEAIGYFNMADAFVGAASDVASKTKEKLAGLFS